MIETFPSAPQSRESDTAPTDGGCCGGPAPAGVDACCVKDADAKASGKAGCGCGAPPKDEPTAGRGARQLAGVAAPDTPR